MDDTTFCFEISRIKIWFQTAASFSASSSSSSSAAHHAHTHRVVMVAVIHLHNQRKIEHLTLLLRFGQVLWLSKAPPSLDSRTGRVVRQINVQVHARSPSVSLQSAVFAVNTAPCAEIVSVSKGESLEDLPRLPVCEKVGVALTAV